MRNVYIYDPDNHVFEQQKPKPFEEIGKEHQAVFKKTEQRTSILNKIMLFFVRCK